MAEKIVLAELDVDERPAAAALGRLDGSSDKLSKAFEHRLFGMREIARAVLGGFGVAGAIEGFRELGLAVLTSQEHFVQFQQAVSRVSSTVVHDLGDIFSVDKSLESIATILDAITIGLDKLKSGSAGTLGLVWEALWGQTPIGQVQQMLDMAAALIKLTMGSALNELTLPETMQGGAGGPIQEVIDFITPFLQKLHDFGQQFPNELAVAVGAIGEVIPFVEEKVTDLDAGLDALVEPSRWQKFKDGLRAAFSLIVTDIERVKDEIQRAFPDMERVTTAVAFGFLALQAAAQSFAQTLVTGLEQGGLTFKRILSGMLDAIGQMLIYIGAAMVAKGIFTYNAHEAVLGLAAMAAGSAAIALSKRWGAGGSNSPVPSGLGASGSASAGAAPAPAGPQITFQIEGNVIATEQWMRQQAIWIKRALADGAAGGAFA